MNQLAKIPETSQLACQTTEAQPPGQEVGVLAREAAAAFQRMVEGHKLYYKCSVQEALAKTEELQSSQVNDPANQPADQMTWFDLHQLGERNPELALQCWQGIRKQALDELQSGHRSAKAMEVCGENHCWDRAQFLAIRDDLAAALQPRNGIEWQLIDAMAQAQTAIFSWMNAMTIYTSLDSFRQKTDIREQRKWKPIRISESQAIEQAGAMCDRFNRIFLRTLRAFQDLRRYAPTVIVQNAGQVNVGQQQLCQPAPLPPPAGGRQSAGPPPGRRPRHRQRQKQAGRFSFTRRRTY